MQHKEPNYQSKKDAEAPYPKDHAHIFLSKHTSQEREPPRDYHFGLRAIAQKLASYFYTRQIRNWTES
jgi:hypothetical protein